MRLKEKYCYGPQQTSWKVSFIVEGQSAPGNSRTRPPPSLALGSWETVCFWQILTKISILVNFCQKQTDLPRNPRELGGACAMPRFALFLQNVILCFRYFAKMFANFSESSSVRAIERVELGAAAPSRCAVTSSAIAGCYIMKSLIIYSRVWRLLASPKMIVELCDRFGEETTSGLGSGLQWKSQIRHSVPGYQIRVSPLRGITFSQPREYKPFYMRTSVSFRLNQTGYWGKYE